MKDNNMLYVAGKTKPVLDDHPELRNRLALTHDGVTHVSTAFINSLTDTEFEIICMMPFTFAMTEDTLRVLQSRIERQGIVYRADVKQKSIHTDDGTKEKS